jgi:hypothetical protein
MTQYCPFKSTVHYLQYIFSKNPLIGFPARKAKLSKLKADISDFLKTGFLTSYKYFSPFRQRIRIDIFQFRVAIYFPFVVKM